MRRGSLRLGLALAAWLAAPGNSQTARFLARAPVPVPARFAGELGGISGIDRDARSGLWYLISDDRAERAPARFYTARIRFARDGTPRTRLVARRTLGLPSPQARAEVPDAEAIRVTPARDRLIWASEGNPRAPAPVVRIARHDGREIGRIPLPFVLTGEEPGQGARPNLGIEGLAYAPGGALWLAMEAPLQQDGEPAAPGRPATVRFTRVDPSGAVGQYAYVVDPVRAVPGEVADNGVSEILAYDDRRLLVLERSGRQQANGHFDFHIRLYLAEVDGAEDIVGLASLRSRAVRPMAKRLLFDFDAVPGRPVANLEGMAWAARTTGGGGRLLLVSDDNFDAEQPTEMVVLRID